MKKTITLLVLMCVWLLGKTTMSMAQTTLAAGDVVILEFNGTGSDGFTFMPLVNLAAGTVIHFTDYGWNATTKAFHLYEEGNPPTGGGNMITYTAPSAITAGTLIRQSTANVGGSAFIADADWSYNYGNYNYIYALNSLSTGHDGILVFQGSPTSPTFILGYYTGQWGKGSYDDFYWSDLPAALTNGTNAVYFADNSSWTADVTVDDGIYSGPTTAADASTWRLRVANSANWTTSSNAATVPLLYPNSYTVNIATGLDNATADALSLYPNPAIDGFSLNAGAQTTPVFIYDLSGRLVLSQQATGKSYIDITSLPKGVYVVKANGLVAKLVKR
jgi:hypothetical protein